MFLALPSFPAFGLWSSRTINQPCCRSFVTAPLVQPVPVQSGLWTTPLFWTALLHVRQCSGSDIVRAILPVCSVAPHVLSHLAEAASYIRGSLKKIDSPIASSYFYMPHTDIFPGALHHRLLPYKVSPCALLHPTRHTKSVKQLSKTRPTIDSGSDAARKTLHLVIHTRRARHLSASWACCRSE